MNKIWDWIDTARQDHKTGFTVGVASIVCITGLCLFSETFRSYLLLLLLIPLLIWVVLKMRGLRFAGMTPDESRNLWYSDKDTYGTAELMDRKRMKEHFSCVPENRCWEAEGDIIGVKDGLVLSRPNDSHHNKHMAVIGASGSMKSRAIVRNKIIGSKRRGESMVITDPKGELFRDTAVWLRKSGYTVRALNLVSLSKSNGWDFMMDALQYCDEGEEAEIVNQMAHVIIQNTGGTADGHSKDDFWDKGERGLLKAIMLYQFYIWKLELGPLSFAWAYRFLMENDIEHLKAAFYDLDKKMPMNGATSAFNIFLKAGEKNGPNIQYGLLSRLDIFKDAPMQRIVGSDEIDLELPAKEKCAYFVITPDQHSTYDFLACLFFTLLFIRLVKFADTKTTTGRCLVPVNLILDEFPNIGEIPDFPKKIATVRSRDISICVLFQSIPDLMQRYPEPGHFRILNNCDYIVFLGGGDPLTADYFSERTGEATIVVDTRAENHSKLDPLHFTLDERESIGAGRRMVKTLNEIQTLAKDNPYMELIVMRDQPVLECEKFDYTRDPESEKWEVFAMSDFNPNDPFWFDDEEEPAIGEAATSKKDGHFQQVDSGPSSPSPGANLPLDLQIEAAEAEKRSKDFLKQQTRELRSAREQSQEGPKQAQTEDFRPKAQSAIPTLKKPSAVTPPTSAKKTEPGCNATMGSKTPPII